MRGSSGAAIYRFDMGYKIFDDNVYDELNFDRLTESNLHGIIVRKSVHVP